MAGKLSDDAQPISHGTPCRRDADPADTRPEVPSRVDVIIVGAGFGGLYQLHRLRGLGMTAKVIEAGAGVGGTWYWNRYPGARCDVESMQYSYAFSEELQQEWRWPELFSGQPEILKYANHVADKLDLRRDILFDTRVTGCDVRRDDASWAVATDRGDAVSARFTDHGDRLPVHGARAGFHGHGRFQGQDLPHRRLAA